MELKIPKKGKGILDLVFYLVFYFSSANLPKAYGQTVGPLVTLEDGSRLRGAFVTGKNGKKVTEFLGIPFAEPPVGELRFRRPAPKKPWRHVLNATKLPNSCIQTSSEVFGKEFLGENMWNPNTELSEDCLYLNIWIPGVMDSNKRLTVMVWIFGGGFWSGTSTLEVYDGKILSSEENVIVASMNYRVSTFGFLYIGRDDAPGNMGLWDQLLSLQWIKQNIQYFGGDPKAVTIFGESAGAASVSMHVVSPRSQDFFQRAILQSSSATAPWAMEEREIAMERALLFSEICRCNVTHRDKNPDFHKMMKCLRSLPAETLRNNEWITFEFCDFPWTPVVDNDFFTEHPKISLERGHFKDSQLLVGTNYDESMYFVIYHHPHIYKVEDFFTKSDWVISDKLFELSAVHPRYGLLPKKFQKNPLVKTAILFEYADWELPGTARKRQQALDKMLGDYHFTCSVNEFAQKYVEHGGSVYYYYFTHRASAQSWPEWMGVLHGYEINFVFGEPLNPDFKYTNDEIELSRRFMKYWANFARTGNPNEKPDKTWTGAYWPLYTKNQEYLTLAVNTSEIGHGPRRRQCAFWKTYIPNLLTATTSLTEMEVRWKQQFSRWETDYITDWNYHFEQYKRLQSYRRTEVESGSCSNFED